MNDKGVITLSSLAVGVSAAALLGVSEVAKANDAEFCTLGDWCNLGYFPLFTGSIAVNGYIPYQYYSQVEGMLEGILQPYIDYYGSYGNGYERYGQCTLRHIAGHPNTYCGCGGSVRQVGLVVDIWGWQGGTANVQVNAVNTYQDVFHLRSSQCFFPPA